MICNVGISFKLLHKEKLHETIHCEDTDVFILACYSNKSLISSTEPFVCKEVISSLLCRDLFHVYLIQKRDQLEDICNVLSESASGP